MTIKAILVLEEKELNLVSVSLTVPPADSSETDNEAKMMLAYLAFSNIISDPNRFEELSKILVPEINKVLEDLESENASTSIN